MRRRQTVAQELATESTVSPVPSIFTYPDTDEVFGATGFLARAFPGYAPRAGQLTMTAAVDAAFTGRTRLLVEGPTGVGKSLAYLVPAVRAAVSEARRTVVVTSGISLQEQLMRKDLPALQRVVPDRNFRFAMLKGVGNYLCREALNDASLDPTAPREVMDVVAGWAQRTETGDLSELDEELPVAAKLRVTTTSDDCLGQRCPSAATCFLLRARNEAKAAQVVVVNYHLFFADLALRAETTASGGEARGILPDYHNAVLDEVHACAEIARSFFGRRMTAGSVRHVSRRAMKVAPDLARTVEQQADVLFAALEAYRKGDRYRARLIDKDVVDSAPLFTSLRAAGKRLRDAATVETDVVAAKKLNAAADSADRLAAFLTAAMELTDGANVVYHLEDGGPRAGVALCGSPVDVAPMLRANLWESPRVGSVVGTSATMGDGRSHDLVAREVGAEGVGQLSVPTPFDWARQAALFVPHDLPLPSERDWSARAVAALADVIVASRGRVLFLSTSHRVLQEAKAALLSLGLPYRILCQGDAPRTRLVERFREDVSSVLLGTSSLWEGVDVQGEALSCVVIDKLPFESPDDPIADFLGGRDKRYFKRVSLPRAVLAFRQGGGRLLRTPDDRGAVVVLDRRIVTKGYGSSFIRGLPAGVPLHRGADWLARLEEHLR